MGSELYKDRLRGKVRPQNIYAQKKPKVFKSETSAKAWADANGVKDYDLVNVRKREGRPKIKIVRKR